MRFKIGDCVSFKDEVTRETQTGTVLNTRTSADSGPVALIRWDDGYRDSWVRQSELKRIP